MTLLHGRCIAKEVKQRTVFESTFLRIYPDLMAGREKVGREIKNNNAMVFNAFEPTMPIIPMDMLINLKTTTGSRLEDRLIDGEQYLKIIFCFGWLLFASCDHVFICCCFGIMISHRN